jgi:hypothetical protein
MTKTYLALATYLALIVQRAKELSDEHGYWEDHPRYSVADWQQETQCDDTRLGYWEWCASKEDQDK